jgi:hypothetical protein
VTGPEADSSLGGSSYLGTSSFRGSSFFIWSLNSSLGAACLFFSSPGYSEALLNILLNFSFVSNLTDNYCFLGSL